MSVVEFQNQQIQQELATPNGVREIVLGMDTLENGQELQIDVDQNIYSPESIGVSSREGDRKISVVGEVGIPITYSDSDVSVTGHAAILKIEHPGGWTGFAIQGLAVDEIGRAHVVAGVDRVYAMPGAKMTFGRLANHQAQLQKDNSLVSAESVWGPGTKYSDETSRRHAELLTVNGQLFIRDLDSQNGTQLRAWKKGVHYRSDKDDGHVAMHTVRAVDIAKERNLISKDMDGRSMFSGRRVVTRDTTLGGPNPEATVDIRAWVGGGEAIVVDPTKYPEYYDKLRNSFFSRLDMQHGKKIEEEDVLRAIYDTVDDTMEYSLEYADKISEEMRSNGTTHRKINLDAYLAEGKGVCRHMALAAAWLGGEAAALGMLDGRLTAPVNQRTEDNAAHEWARYTARNGQVYILDIAQHYFGTLESSAVRKDFWNYFQNGERDNYMQRFGHLSSTPETKAPEVLLEPEKHDIGWVAVKSMGLVNAWQESVRKEREAADRARQDRYRTPRD